MYIQYVNDSITLLLLLLLLFVLLHTGESKLLGRTGQQNLLRGLYS